MFPAEDVLHWGFSEFGPRFAVVTSFQKEGMVLVDMASRLGADVRVITLDTGRLPEETLAMISAVESRYGLSVERIQPDPGEVSRMVAAHSEDLFRKEVVLRKLCCQVRKVRPMDALLRNLDAYSVGLRRGQSDSREKVEQKSQVDGKWKLSPLAFWTASEVEEYTATHGVPVHPLYSQGYTSIGCGPCTRAVHSSEGERAGRWWWEVAGDKECGLHFTPEGKMVRELDVLLSELVHA
ncbi:MAG TPA: phosphoadenylyl-sulfate reductase [Bryobacteraceae bacterium]|nr:phosphoadenylyl-sulfate reductase [Bryobacteraceae bacterium]